MNTEILKRTVILAVLLFTPMTGCASDGDRSGRRQRPPAEAIEACKGKSVGDSVTFTGRRGETLQASCREIEGQLAAVPEGRHLRGNKPV